MITYGQSYMKETTYHYCTYVLFSPYIPIVMINGFLSKPYRVTRGVCQGDWLSCLLSNLAIEPLAEMLRKSSLQGFCIPGVAQHLITFLFADNTIIFLSEEDGFDTLLSILNKWCMASGAKFNIPKTEIVPLRRSTETGGLPHTISTPTKP